MGREVTLELAVVPESCRSRADDPVGWDEWGVARGNQETVRSDIQETD